MVERDFIEMVRSGDEGVIKVRKEDITAVVDNANEDGIIEGCSAIYLRHGLAFAVNHTPAQVMALIAATEIVQ